MFSVGVKGSLDQLAKAVGTDGPKKLRREVSTAINATARKTKNFLAKEVSKELATPQKVIKTTIAVSRKSKPATLGATVKQKPTARIPLKEFKARQTKKGVSYKTSKSRGRSFVKSGFIVDSLGGHAFKRRGKSRKPIDKLHGPSPWGVTIKNKLDKTVAERDVEPEMVKQINRRIKAVNFKKSKQQAGG